MQRKRFISIMLYFEPSKMKVVLENTLYKTFEVVNDDYVEIVAEGTIYWSDNWSRFYFIPSSRASQVPLPHPLWFQAKFKFNSKSSKSLSQFHHSVNMIISWIINSISLYIFVTNCLYHHRFFSFSFSSSTPCTPNKLGCSIQTRLVR